MTLHHSKQQSPVTRPWPAKALLPLLGCTFAFCNVTARAQAVQPPDAGLLKREQEATRPPRMPGAAVAPLPSVAASAPMGALAAERKVVLQRLTVEGVTVLDEADLLSPLQFEAGRGYTLAEMRALAAKVQRRLQNEGRPYARAYLPPQNLSTGELLIAVVEGRYGEVKVEGAHAEAAKEWLTALVPGQPIGAELNRQVQALQDLPGVTTTATLAPGQQAGEGDVLVQVEPGSRVSGDVRLDNHGSRYAGTLRATATLRGNGLMTLGDTAYLALGGNNGHGWQGAAGYSLPVGRSGARAGLSLSRSHYALGKEFAALGASGEVEAVGAQLSVPLVLSGNSRLEWQSGLQLQRISNEQAAVSVSDHRHVALVNGSLRFSSLVPGGGAAWGNLTAELGRTKLQDQSRAVDAATAGIHGSVLALSTDATLLKPFGAWSVSVRGAGQLAQGNLDPSRKFVLGGAEGVRAWPTGEAAGDDGVLTQAELRYRMGNGQPFMFFDAGRVRLNHRPWDTAVNTRSLVGGGVGLRWFGNHFNVAGTVGFRIGARRDRPVSDPAAHDPQVLLSVTYVP